MIFQQQRSKFLPESSSDCRIFNLVFQRSTEEILLLIDVNELFT